MTLTVLDTDILSEILKQRNATVVAKANDYLAQFGCFTFSAISRFEILRGYLSVNATSALRRFETVCQNSVVLPVTDLILDRAAQLWSDAAHGGHPQGDADLIIAATALEYGYTLASGNTRHYDWIAGLTVENWRLP